MNIPKLRLNCFTEPLTSYRIGDLYTERKEHGDESLPMLTVSIHSGVSDGELEADELGKRVARSEDKTKYKRAEADDIVFNMMRAWQGAIGVVRTTGMVSPAYIVAKPNQLIYPLFMDYYMKTPQMINKINRLSYGLMDFRKRLYWDSFVTIDCFLPSITEQKEIVSLFDSVDELLSIIQKEISLWEKKKIGIVQKIFSREMSSQTGDDCVEWKKVRFGDIGDYITTKPLSWSDITEDGDSCILYGQLYTDYGEVIQNIVSKTTLDTTIAMKNDLLFPSSTTADAISLIAPSAVQVEKVKVGGDLFIVRPKLDVNASFLSYMINDYVPVRKMFASKAQGLTIVHLSYTNIENINVFIPNRKEQDRIVDLLMSIDEVISCKKKKLELWKNIKKGLLQQMFV